MIIFPAIDLKDGKPVRLTKGDFSTTEQVADDALETAKRFEAEGATHLHMVDLDGALTGEPVSGGIVKTITEGTSLFVEIGGGIRTRKAVEYYLDLGVARVILGSAAIQNPDFTKEMIQRFGERVAVGIDAKGGMASGGGWLDDSSVYFIDLARVMDEAGVSAIIYTDIAKDGTLAGPNIAELDELNKAVKSDVVASGGVASISDVKALSDIGAAGVICGKSIYKGTLSLKEALAFQR
ncbi:MAG: 1-(5-phosphoribosyl)-5-[(5-phosphoribosylamino)methylideneamino]imidazole-4-carboxamide isomerase [Clostridiales Family XIII bacterium]|jgi:phosphoribosylformimino-5-aminoimidazole carboxamide ribotide isomerase|nr:1-(5-phosphoribosyl)-5-[(5-phosphoribosylamino)methylideneamino]imidazole-4-carboxamide isomerase [Clostridiales Family XIII bacterium]